MRKRTILLAIVLGAMVLCLSGCGPQGGIIMLVNESSYKLNSPYISMGDHSEDVLLPGESMKSSVDSNSSIRAFNVTFKVEKAITVLGVTTGENVKELIVIDPDGGNWSLLDVLESTWTSPGLNVNDGETVIITVKNKPQP